MLLLVIGSCRELPPCEPELKSGMTYAASISEAYYATSSAKYDYVLAAGTSGPPCKGFDGLVPGAEVPFKVTKTFNQGGCQAPFGVVTVLPNGERWQETYTEKVGGGFERHNVFFAEGVITSGQCQGAHRLFISHPDKKVSMFTPTEPGHLPSMLLGRTFRLIDVDGGADCPEICGDIFVAQLAEGKE